MLRILLITSVLLLAAAIAGCGPAPESSHDTRAVQVADKPEVAPEQIIKDVVGSVVRISDAAGTGPADEWTFEIDEFKQVEILESQRSGNQLTVLVHMTTRNNPKPEENSIQVAGKLRLRYELKNGKWILDGIENLTFQYSIGVAT